MLNKIFRTLCLIALFTCTAHANEEIEKYIKNTCECENYPEEIRENFNNNNYIDSISRLNEIITKEPQNYQANLAKADILAICGSKDEAVKIINKLIEENPENGLLYYKRALINCLNLNPIKQNLIPVKEDLDRAARLKEMPLDFYIVRAQINEYLTLFKNARNDYTLYIENNCQYEPGAYFKRANVNFYDENYKEAIKDYDAILQVTPGFGTALLNRGYAKYKSGDHKGAAADIEEALNQIENIKGEAANCTQDPETLAHICPIKAFKEFDFMPSEECIDNAIQSEILFTLASALAKSGQYACAYEIYEKISAQSPNDFRVYLSMAYINYANNNDNIALYYFEEALKIKEIEKTLSKKGIADIYIVMSTIYLNQKDKLNAYNCLIKASKYNSKDQNIYYKKAQINFMNQEFEKAIKNLEKATKINPNNPELLCIKGTIYGRLNQFEKAIENFTNAIKADENYANAYYSRAIAYKSCKKPQEALNDARKAHKLYSKEGKAIPKLNEMITELEKEVNPVN